MPNTLTIAQLQDAKALITSGDITGFYLYMANQGYGYANLANEMVTGYGTAGNAAQSYMVARAAEQGITLTAQTITQIEATLATKYANLLIQTAGDNGGSIAIDVNFIQAREFHTDGFGDYGLGPQTWTLYTPGQLLGEAKMEALWPTLIDPNNASAIFPGWTSLAIEMGSVWWNGGPADSAAAGQWLGSVADAVTFGSSPAIPDPLRFLLPFMFDSSSLSGGDPSRIIDSFSVSLGGDVDVVGLADSYAELSIPLSSTIDASGDGSGAAQASANAQSRQAIYDLWVDSLQSVQTLDPTSTVNVSMHDASGNQMQVQVGSSATGQVTQVVNTTVNGSSANVIFEFDDAGNAFLQSVTSINGSAPTDATSLIEALNAAGITPSALMDTDAGTALTAYDATNPANNPSGSVTNTIDISNPYVTSQTSVTNPTDPNNVSGVESGQIAPGVSMDPSIVNGSVPYVSAEKGAIAGQYYMPGGERLSPTLLQDAQLLTWGDVFQAASGSSGSSLLPVDPVVGAYSNALNLRAFGIDPLILDLNGDGVKLTSYQDTIVLFDVDHDGGSKEQTGWVAANTITGGTPPAINTDGIVVQDLNSNGMIDNISETLSEYFNGTVGTNGNAGTKPFTDGFDALKRSFDSNNDNVFNSADAAWNNLRVWVDDNADGVSFKDVNGNGTYQFGIDTSELKTFAQLGITQINLINIAQLGEVRDGNEVLARGTFVQSGQTKEAIAADFLANPNGTTFTPSGTGTHLSTEGNITSYVAASATGEVIDVAVKGVQNAYGAQGNDRLIGDTNDNWLAGGVGSDTFTAGAGDRLRMTRRHRRTVRHRRASEKWNHCYAILTNT